MVGASHLVHTQTRQSPIFLRVSNILKKAAMSLGDMAASSVVKAPSLFFPSSDTELSSTSIWLVGRDLVNRLVCYLN